MKTAILYLTLCALVLRANGDHITLWTDFDSPDAFVSAVAALRPTESHGDLSSLFTMRDQGQPEDPKTGMPIRAPSIESSAKLWADESHALVFVTAHPPTQGTRSAVGVLFLLTHMHDRWHVSDHLRFTASGKYASVAADITGSAGTGNGVHDLPIVTIKESGGGRGHSFQASATYTIYGARLKRMELE